MCTHARSLCARTHELARVYENATRSAAMHLQPWSLQWTPAPCYARWPLGIVWPVHIDAVRTLRTGPRRVTPRQHSPLHARRKCAFSANARVRRKCARVPVRWAARDSFAAAGVRSARAWAGACAESVRCSEIAAGTCSQWGGERAAAIGVCRWESAAGLPGRQGGGTSPNQSNQL